MCQHRLMPKRLTAALLIAIAGLSAASCGDTPKQVPSADRSALDNFAAATRDWRRQGTEPWNKALAAGQAELAIAGPKAESHMKKAIADMEAAAKTVSNAKVRSGLDAIISSYKAKLAAVHKVDTAGYSLARFKQGLVDLKAAGAKTLKAWNAYVKQAKAEWNSNPLAGLNLG